MRNLEQDFDSLVNDLGSIVENVTADRNINNFDMRRVLRFFSKVILVLEQAYQEVLGTMIDFKYVNESDVESGKLIQLRKDLELLRTRSRYRDAEEICSRLHFLNDQYRTVIRPIINNLDNGTRWGRVFNLLDEQEGRIIMLVDNSIRELQDLIQRANIQEINYTASKLVEAISESLSKLRNLNNQILGLSGPMGLLELTEDRDALDNARILINSGDYISKQDNYYVGQAGAVGPNSHVQNMNFSTISNPIDVTMDLSQLSVELFQLRAAMRKEATDAEQDISISEVAKAEQASKANDGSKVAKHLKSAGGWALEIATKIGVQVAIEAIKKSLVAVG